MEVSEAVCQQDRLQLLSEKRKWQTEIENKRRQLEDDRRTLQHLKSKALRERWLLDGAPSAGPEQDKGKNQLEQDEAKTRSLEETINRSEEELLRLETGGVCQTKTHNAVSPGPIKEVKGHSSAVEVKGHSGHQQATPAVSGRVVQEVKVQKSPGMSRQSETAPDLKRAMYSVEIKVERDKVTGETRVLSTNTRLPVDLSHQGVKVYEDEQKVVHEMNGEDGVQLLSFSEVEELILKADEASMMSQTVATVTSLPTAEVQEEAGPEDMVPSEITGLESKPSDQPSATEASAENPITMVFMGYQNVEDEDATKKVLGLQGTVKAELVLIEDAEGKTSPGEESGAADLPPPVSTAPPASTKPPEPGAAAASNGETAGEAQEAQEAQEVQEVEIKKEKQPCKCCSIM